MRRYLTVLSFCLLASLGVQPAFSGHLGTFVVVGDSLSAGFQNFSLYTTGPDLPPGGQQYGYAQLIAKQAGTDLQNPTVTYPGIPPVLIGGEKGTPVSRYPGTGMRVSPVQTLNLSVPSYTVADALGRQVDLVQLPLGTNGRDVLEFTVLGPPTMCGALDVPTTKVTLSSINCAVSLNPDTVLVSLGNDDALQALTFGYDPTPEDAFKASYHEVIRRLNQTHPRMILANVPDVTNIPFLWTSADFIRRCGALPAGAKSNDYFVPNLVDPSSSGYVCDKPVIRSNQTVQAARHAATKYNKIIADEAKALNNAENDDTRAIVVDINGLFDDISKKGIDIGGKHLTTAFLCGLFSRDGMHPTNTGYAIMANEAIDTINTAWKTSIPKVDLEQMAATDPLVF